MIFKKMGLMFDKHAQLPTAIVLGDRIRIYYSSRVDGKSLIYYFEVDANFPDRILFIGEECVLSCGKRGCFDDSGVMPSSILKIGNELWMYYSGWNCDKGLVPYGHGIGLAKCELNKSEFVRISDGPIIDRSIFNPYLCNSPYVNNNCGFWNMLYCSGTGWSNNFPKYIIRKASSIDGLSWILNCDSLIGDSNEDAVSRPWMFKDSIWYSSRKENTNYKIKSTGEILLEDKTFEWESDMNCYPCIIEYGSRVYMFYNGNGYGASGIGWAELK